MTKTWKPTTSGILSIISGAMGMIFGFLTFARAHKVVNVNRQSGLHLLGLLLFVLGAIAIAGGIFALLRKIWGLALAGSICAIFSPGGIMGILALIFVSISKEEFKSASGNVR
jgi:hypothetical protein